ncbi:spore coat protein CotJB [Petroclostridium sp. X23]|uniref:spore coat protein CotJB n=1 Tax=Petroclostridium sp. X23 TaxID=3045146 RepID=UPI0024ADAC16|nr:spore coat protein CotJB [Petroclostridium sp. X23]WHH59389.1 spore coat protein CotJB [Petroclostridium sp. X23]
MNMNMNMDMDRMHMSRDEMLKQLSALDFMVIDLHLYLDTHPCDREALMKYNCVAMQANMLRNTYERMYGPINAYGPIHGYPWQWNNNPWPWSAEFNFQLAGEEC